MLRSTHRCRVRPRRAALTAALLMLVAVSLLAACAPGRSSRPAAPQDEQQPGVAADIGTDHAQGGAEAADGAENAGDGEQDDAEAADGTENAGNGEQDDASAGDVAQEDGAASSKPAAAVQRKPTARPRHASPVDDAPPAQAPAITRGNLLVPPGYNRSRSYPLLVVLPYTGGTAQNLLEYYLFTEYNPGLSLQAKWEHSLRTYYPDGELLQQRAYFILLPDGKGTTRDHSYRGFARAIERYEQRIMLGIREAVKEYAIDPHRIILAGHSLGGDLSWAISLRNPTTFSGAMISGSRTSYWEDDRLPILAKRNFRYFFAMGTAEQRVRLNGLKQNLDKLTRRGVSYRYWRTPMVGHQPPKREQLAQALDYVFFGPQPENEGTKPRPQVASKSKSRSKRKAAAAPKHTSRSSSKQSAVKRTATASK